MVEDLHDRRPADPAAGSTTCCATGPEPQLLVVATARREECPDGHPLAELVAGVAARGRLVELELDASTGMGTHCWPAGSPGRRCPTPDARRLHAETEGNPLFVVEAVRAGWTAGAHPRPRVHAVIESRLAQSGRPGRRAGRGGGAIGREFGATCWPRWPRSTRTRWCTGWTSCGGGDRPRAGLDATTSPTSGSARPPTAGSARPGGGCCTGRTAAALERSGAPAARVAAHHDRAGDRAAAIRCAPAGRGRGRLLHAHPDARPAPAAGAGLLAELAPGDARDALELDVRAALLPPLALTGGYASAELAATQQRHLDLAASPARRCHGPAALAGGERTGPVGVRPCGGARRAAARRRRPHRR
jgi:hypothetical protein